MTRERVSDETIRNTLKRLGIQWKRAEHWIPSSDPGYKRRKNGRDRLIAWAERHPECALGFQDETSWSRVTQPHVHAWADAGAALRLIEQASPKDDPDPKALACYGLLVSCPAVPASLPEQVWLRFVDGRPISGITTHYLAWCYDRLAQLGKKALLLVWDNASWHIICLFPEPR